MKEASPFEVEGLFKATLAAAPGTAPSTPGRHRKLSTKNKRQTERRAREIADLIQREDWEALSLEAQAHCQHLRLGLGLALPAEDWRASLGSDPAGIREEFEIQSSEDSSASPIL